MAFRELVIADNKDALDEKPGILGVRELNNFWTLIEGTLSQTFFGLFSKTAPKLRLSSFNHAGNAPRT